MNLKSILYNLKFITVEPVVFVYMMVIMMETNALQELVYVKSCYSLNFPANISDCSYNSKGNHTDVTSVSATWNKYLALCLFSLSLLVSFYAGSWSDKIGRKIPMLIPLMGTAVAATVNCILSIFIHSSVGYLFISAVISGLTLGTAGIVSSGFGYIADHSTESSRTKRIVILEAMLISGNTLGTYLAGIFMESGIYEDKTFNGIAQLFAFEVVSAITIAIYVYFRIPRYESSLSSYKDLLSLQHFVDSVNTVIRPRENKRRLDILLLLFVGFLVNFGIVVNIYLGYYYTKDTLKWGMKVYSRYSSLQTLVQGGMLLIGLPIVLHFFRPNDYFVAAGGLLSRTTGLILFGLSTTPYMIYICVGLFVFSEYPVPAIRSLLSKHVDEDERGKIFGFMAALQTFSWLLGTLILMTIFTSVEFRGLCFEVVGGLHIIALLIIIYLYFSMRTTSLRYQAFKNDEGNQAESSTSTVLDS